MTTDTDSRVDTLQLRGRRFFVKRDDLVDPLLSGNKFRKLHSLIRTPAGRYRALRSYGGAQSNAMLALAALCRRKGWQFHYTVKTLPERLRQHPTGNLKQARELGMQLREVAHDQYDQAVAALFAQQRAQLTEQEQATLLVPQGGADPIARAGIGRLADEIRRWQQRHDMDALHVVTPSGTGTTACYLAAALPAARVLTTAVVGDHAYLIQQMRRLGPIPDNLRILTPARPFRFARPDPALLAIHQELNSAGIAFDLIYGALMWHALLQHLDTIDGPILYVHSGGLSGNETMLDRYRHSVLPGDP